MSIPAEKCPGSGSHGIGSYFDHGLRAQVAECPECHTLQPVAIGGGWSGRILSHETGVRFAGVKL